MHVRMVLAALGLAANACVVGAQRPPSRLELSRAPVTPRATPDAARSAAPPACTPPSRRETPPRKPASDVVWIDAECRYDGTGYRYVAGRWEPRRRPYRWR